MVNYRLFIGNPGVGKSTLVNCITQRVLFKNGVSIGSGLTYEMEIKSHNDVTYMDTPGLDDIRLRKTAAEAITKALRKDGQYQIFFVVTSDAGRVRPKDVATIKLVLENAVDITNYNLIINQLSPRLYKDLLKNDRQKLKELLVELNNGRPEHAKPPKVLLILRDDYLDANNNCFVRFKELDTFVENAAYVTIHSEHVSAIPCDGAFDKLVALMESQLQELRSDNKRMKQQLAETMAKYENLMENQAQQNEFSLFDMLPVFGPLIKYAIRKAKKDE